MEYHATPYDIHATGFYFTDYEDYKRQAASHLNKYDEPVEEYEIQYIDGDKPRLFSLLSVSQATLWQWFDEYESLDRETTIKAMYLAENGETIETILNAIDEIIMYEGTAASYAEEYIDGSGMLDPLPASLKYYFDYEGFSRDLLLNGDIDEVTIEGTTYVFERG